MSNTNQLHNLCTIGNVKRVKMLLSAVNETEKYNLLELHEPTWNNTPLIEAALNGQIACVRFLLEAGADMDATDKEGNTALILSAGKGQETCVHLLLEKGAKVNATNQFGSTALHKAAYAGHGQCVRLLLGAKADVNATDDKKNTALLLAAMWNHEDCVQLLVKGNSNINTTDLEGRTALLLAATWGCEGVVKTLLASDAEMLSTNMNGNNALHIAAENGDIGTTEALLGGNGSSTMNLLSALNKDENTPLMLAKNHKSVIRAIQDFEACRSFLDCGSSSIINEDEDATALHIAAEHGWELMVHELLHKCDAWDLVNAYNKKGQKPEDVAKEKERTKVIEVLECFYFGPVKMQARFRGNTCRKNLNKQYLEKHKAHRKKISSTPCKSHLQRGRSAKILEDASKHNGKISRKNVMLISRDSFCSAGSLPHYRRCGDQHYTAAMLNESDEVLFVSHRWGGAKHPDPGQKQYKLVLDFLNSPEGENINYVWVDYSCICQDKSSELFRTDLQNIPTAVWSATHFLIIPQISKDACIPATDLKDYMERAWCLLELMAALITGTTCYVTFMAGSSAHHIQIEADKEFSVITKQVWALLHGQSFFDKETVDTECLFQQWTCASPCHLLDLLENLSTNKDLEVQSILQKALDVSISIDDIIDEPRAVEVLELYSSLGDCLYKEDKLCVLNLLLFIWGYHRKSTKAGQVDQNGKNLVESFKQGEDAKPRSFLSPKVFCCWFDK